MNSVVIVPRSSRRVSFGAPLLFLVSLFVATPMSASAQSIRAIPTYHNIGIHIDFDATPADGTTISMATKEENAPGDYKPAHPLSQIASNRFAGSVFALRSDTTYAIRLSSPAFASNRLLSVRTRSEIAPAATNAVYHLRPDGDDTRDGRSFATAFRTLRHALEVVMAGERIVLHEGRYNEGEIEVFPGSSGEADATATHPIVIESAPGERAILDGTDSGFVPQWEVYDGIAGVYRTATARQPYHAYLNGGHLYRFGILDHLRTNRWSQMSGFFSNGAHLYVRLPDGAPIGTNRITIPRFTFALLLGVNHYQLRDLEFCYYGFDRGPAAIVLDNSSSNRIQRCNIHHTGTGISIRHDSIHNTIERCSFNEWPVDTMMWDAIKQGEPFGSEPYENGGVVMEGDHTVYYGNVIRSNRFEHMFDGAHLFSDDHLAPTEDLDFHDNIVLNCGDDGVETDGVGSNCRIYSNVFSNFLTGISVAPAALGPTYIVRNALLRWRSIPSVEGEDGRFYGYPIKLNHQMREDPWTSSVYLYHNTCFTDEPGLDGFLFSYYWWYWTNIVSRNNIYAGTSYALRNVNEQDPVDFDYDDLFTTASNRFIQWFRADFSDLAAFTQATGQERHGLTLNPRFVEPGNIQLRADSPLINRGIVIPGINDNFSGSAPDIGAFESSSTPFASIVRLVDGFIEMTWRVPPGLWQLEGSDSLSPAQWGQLGSSIQSSDQDLILTQPAVGAMRFYRLRSAL